MATKKTTELLEDCDAQLDSLRASLGKLLFENIQANAISYYFEPTDDALAAQAKKLLRDIVVQKISGKKPKPTPVVISVPKTPTKVVKARLEAKPQPKFQVKPEVKPDVKTQSKLQVKPEVKLVVKPQSRFQVKPEVKLVVKPQSKFQVKPEVKLEVKPDVKPQPKFQVKPEVKLEVKPDVKPQPKLQVKLEVKPEVKLSMPKPAPKANKSPIAAIISGAKNVFLKENHQPALGVEHRGQLEPYVKLVADLHILKNRLLEVQQDLNECISLGLLHTMSERTTAYQDALNKKIQIINSLIQKKQEEIKFIMENKKRALAENSGNTAWEPEKDFLKQAGQELSRTAGRIDELINEVVGLFKNIKEVYEKDLEEGRLAREKEMRLVTLPPVVEYAQEPTPSLPPEEFPVEEDSPALSVEEPPAEEENEEDLEPLLVEGQGEEEDDEEASDYGLFETASRKLESDIADNDEKLAVLHALFRNAPKRAVPFLYDLIKDADMFLKKQLTSLLSLLDYPTLVDLYRRFITDKNSSLRLHGLMGLVKLGSDEARHVILSTINDRDPHVRRFIVNCLAQTSDEPEASAIARLANDSDASVARIAIRKLGHMANHFAFVTLVPKLEDVRIKIRKEVIDALQAITGTDLNYDYAAPPSERRGPMREWRRLVTESYTRPRLLRELREQSAKGRPSGSPLARQRGRTSSKHSKGGVASDAVNKGKENFKRPSRLPRQKLEKGKHGTRDKRRKI